jgi:hypothetical protein
MMIGDERGGHCPSRRGEMVLKYIHHQSSPHREVFLQCIIHHPSLSLRTCQLVHLRPYYCSCTRAETAWSVNCDQSATRQHYYDRVGERTLLAKKTIQFCLLAIHHQLCFAICRSNHPISQQASTWTMP